MSNKKVAKLDFVVGMVDQASQDLIHLSSRVDNAFGNINKSFNKHMGSIAKGSATLWASAFAVDNIVSPGAELSKSLKPLEFAMKDNISGFDDIKKNVLDVSNSYGIAANEIGRSSTHINKMLNDVSPGNLEELTKHAAVLTKVGGEDSTNLANKALTSAIAQNQELVDKMGLENYSKMFVGQATKAINSGMTLDGINTTINDTNADAKGLGVDTSTMLGLSSILTPHFQDSNDSQAFLLQFLEQIRSTPEKIGMNFNDKNGNLLGFDKIIEKLQNNFAGVDLTKGSDASKMLDDAFGDGGKVIQLLLRDTKLLNKVMQDFSTPLGYEDAVDQADFMTDGYFKLTNQLHNTKIAFSDILYPALKPVLEKIILGSGYVANLADRFPVLAEYIGYATVGLIGFIAFAAFLSILKGSALIIKGFAGSMLFAGTAMIKFIVLGALVAAAVIVVGIFIWGVIDIVKMFLNLLFKAGRTIMEFFGLIDKDVEANLDVKVNKTTTQRNQLIPPTGGNLMNQSSIYTQHKPKNIGSGITISAYPKEYEASEAQSPVNSFVNRINSNSSQNSNVQNYHIQEVNMEGSFEENLQLVGEGGDIGAFNSL